MIHHRARSKFDHGAGLSPNNGYPSGLNKAEQRSTNKSSASFQKAKKGNCSHEQEYTEHYEFYDPTEEEPKWKPLEGFTEFLLTNFDLNLVNLRLTQWWKTANPLILIHVGHQNWIRT